MGANDAEEMLEAAKADAVILERTIADLQDRLDTIRALCDQVDEQEWLGPSHVVEVSEVREILDRRQSDARGVFLRDHDAHEIAAAIRAGQTEPMSAHGEDVVSRMERA